MKNVGNTLANLPIPIYKGLMYKEYLSTKKLGLWGNPGGRTRVVVVIPLR